MSILWAGGEDIDFCANGIMPRVDTTAAHFNSGYARCAVNLDLDSGYTTGNAFSGGAVTTAWLSFYIWPQNTGTSIAMLGLGNTSDCATGKGLYLYTSAADQTRLSIAKRDGSDWTVLDTEAGNSLANQTLSKIDIVVTDYADTDNGNVKVYVNGGASAIIDYTGDLTVTGLSSLDCVILARNTAATIDISEVIVADEDTRTMRLATLYLSGAGTTLEWTGAYSNLDEISLSDADLAYSNTTGQKAQYALSDTPAGQFSVPAIMVSFRGCKTSGASIEKIKSGVLSAATEDLDAGQTMTTSWVTYNRLMTTINGSQITTAVLDAAELDFNSLT